MTNYLKKIIFSLLILGMPYMMSVSNAMEPENYDGQRSIRRISAVQQDDQGPPISVVQKSASLRNMSREDWKPAMDAVSSSVKTSVLALAQVPFDLVEYGVNNPGTTAAFLATCLFAGTAAETLGAAEAAEIAGTCACFCLQGVRSFFSGVCANNAAGCQSACKQLPMDKCVPAPAMGCR